MRLFRRRPRPAAPALHPGLLYDHLIDDGVPPAQAYARVRRDLLGTPALRRTSTESLDEAAREWRERGWQPPWEQGPE